jgi:hypothetical protein
MRHIGRCRRRIFRLGRDIIGPFQRQGHQN